MTKPTTTSSTTTATVSIDSNSRDLGLSAGEGRVVEITSEPVELYKILKFEGMAESGGQAKAVIADGHVSVNGKVELQKRKKIVSGDFIEFNGHKIAIHFSKPPSVAPPVTSPTTPAAKP